MFKNYLKVAFRNIRKNKVFSLINISGLALGLSIGLLIMLWVNDERNMDRFMANSSRMFCVYTRSFYENNISADYSAPGLLADELKRKFPEIKYATGVSWQGPNTFQVGDKVIRKFGLDGGDDFFSVFSYTLLTGSPKTALSTPSSISISREMAKDFFGTPEEAMGKTLRFEDRREFKVTAVFENVPKNASRKFDFVLNWHNYLLDNEWAKDWTNIGPRTYLMLDQNVDATALQGKLTHFLDLYDPRSGKGNFKIELAIQPYDEMYLYSNFKNGKIDGGRIEYVRIFTIIAVFILFIACINFMNLSTARSASRAKEIGVRKVAGARRGALIGQFIGEAILLVFLASIIATVVVLLLLPAFNSLTGKDIQFPFASPFFWLSLVGLTFVTGFIAGSYPALFLSSFNPVKIFKGAVRMGSGVVFVRKGLVVFQFTLCIVLIISMVVISRQLNYIQGKNLGFDRVNLIYIPMEGELAGKYGVFKNDVSRMPGVAAVTSTSQIPFLIQNSTGDVSWDNKDLTTNPHFAHLAVGYDFVSTMGVQLLAGRDFSREYGSDSAAYLLNESALKLIGYKDPIGRTIIFKGKKGIIVGELKDFHFATMHEPIRPLIIRLLAKEDNGVALVKTKPGATRSVMQSLGTINRELSPRFPFNYLFADEVFQNLYNTELLTGKLADYFALIAILISCLGLFGLAIFTAEQRAREISIRKILGASTSSLLYLMSREFMALILLSFLVAAPAAWIMMNNWLDNYAYRIGLSWWIFPIAGLASVLIALFTVSFQSFKAVRANPVKTLRAQ